MKYALLSSGKDGLWSTNVLKMMFPPSDICRYIACIVGYDKAMAFELESNPRLVKIVQLKSWS